MSNLIQPLLLLLLPRFTNSVCRQPQPAHPMGTCRGTGRATQQPLHVLLHPTIVLLLLLPPP
jgi:hypothetical protein